MGQLTSSRRRLPPIGGVYGWLGLICFGSAVTADVAAAGALVSLAMHRDAKYVGALAGTVLLSFGLFGTAGFLWRQGLRRAGQVQPTLSVDQRTRAGAWTALIYLGGAIGIVGFVVIVLNVGGIRRLAFAMALLIVSAGLMHQGTIGVGKLVAPGRPLPFKWSGSGLRLTSFLAALTIGTLFFLTGLVMPSSP